MKTAISIPDNVFQSAEELAQRLGKSRSQLYANALSCYLEEHNTEKITEQLNAVYSPGESRLDPKLKTMQQRSLAKENW